MAIGSDPEVGVEFTRWGDMDDMSKLMWFRYMQLHWGPDLLGGYAALIYPTRKEHNNED